MIKSKDEEEPRMVERAGSLLLHLTCEGKPPEEPIGTMADSAMTLFWQELTSFGPTIST
jgi:hypothetical protein